MSCIIISIWTKRVSDYQCFMARIDTKLRVGVSLGIEEWSNRCNLPPSSGEFHLQHLPISDIGYRASMNGKVACILKTIEEIERHKLTLISFGKARAGK